MKTELGKQLCEKFPKLFADRHGDMQETCMVWGFACGDGWFNIIHALCANIQWHIDQSVERNANAIRYEAERVAAVAGDFTVYDNFHPSLIPTYREQRHQELLCRKPRVIPEIIEQVTVNQVKEKFGTLRFYYSGGDAYIDGLVAMAESMSAVTCEECGKPGRVRPGGWLRCQCDEHAQASGNYLTEEDESLEP
jgi:hypothetical protein